MPTMAGEAAISPELGSRWRARVGRFAHLGLTGIWALVATAALGTPSAWSAAMAMVLLAIAALIDWRSTEDERES